MLVRRFLHRLAEGDTAERAEIVTALTRVYREAPLDADNREAAATALIAILDDPAPRVRRALARGLADCADAPHAVVMALAEDQPDIAQHVLWASPVLDEATLIDLVGALGEPQRLAIARRPEVGVGLSAAIVELSGPEACLGLLANPGACVAAATLRRLAERHRRDPAVRSALLARDDIPVTLRQTLIDGLSEALGDLVTARAWLAPERTDRLVREARERAVVDLVRACEPARLRPLVEHLAADGRLTPALIVRSACVGNVSFFEESLAVLSRMPVRRVASLIHDRSGTGFPALFRRTGLPASCRPALRAVVAALGELAPDGRAGAVEVRGQRMIERVLTHYQAFADGEVDEFFSLLGRLASEAARQEAREHAGGYFRAA